MSTMRTAVAWAGRILALYGHGDLTLGHVSVRDGNRIYMKRKGIGLEEVAPADVLTLDLIGRKTAGTGTAHLEVVLHTEVYRAREDVGAVIHTHPIYATALSAVAASLQYVTHDAVMFPEGIGVFEDTADLVVTPDVGAAVARSLGPRRAVLLRNHGVLVVGKDVRWAVLAALTLERAVRMQAVAESLGILKPIPESMVASQHASKYRESFLDEYWEYWVRCVRRAGLDSGMPAARTKRRSR